MEKPRITDEVYQGLAGLKDGTFGYLFYDGVGKSITNL